MDSSASSHSYMPEILGPFRLLLQLGAGGMGTVYLAERMEQFSQQVAVKILHPQLFPNLGNASIEREARVLAALDHPGIVRLLDVNTSENGLSYIVMEYVDGLPIHQYCDAHRLTISFRMELLLDVFDALEYAHRRLVVHSDLKPENILVTKAGKPRLLDFGVATAISAIGAGVSESSDFTVLYSSPEQRTGERLTVASDVYALGLIALTLLAGVPPRPVSLSALQDSAAPPRPLSASRSLAVLPIELQEGIAADRSTTPAGLQATLQGDIDAILAKALQVDPTQRFESVQEMIEEFRRYLAGYPIQTRPSRWTIQVRKWVLRNRIVSGLAALFFVALVLSAVGVVSQAREAAKKRQIAQTRLHDLVRLTDVLAGELYDSTRGLQGSDEAQAALLDSAHDTIHQLTAETENDPQLRLELAAEYAKLARLEFDRTPSTQPATKRASDDLREGIKLLEEAPQNDPEAKRLRETIPELIRLESSSSASHSH